MDECASLILAYRDQLARIRAAFNALEFEECYAVQGLEELEAAINDTGADDLEALRSRNAMLRAGHLRGVNPLNGQPYGDIADGDA